MQQTGAGTRKLTWFRGEESKQNAATDAALPHERCLKAEPRSAGSAERGRHLAAGRFPHAGELIPIPVGDLWRLADGPEPLPDVLHGFAWLADLAALRTREAVRLARQWTFDWIDSSVSRQDAVWRPNIAGRRVINLRHSEFVVLSMASDKTRAKFAAALRRHAKHLSERGGSAEEGLPRTEALSGLVFAELAAGGSRREAEKAANLLADASGALIAPETGIASRNPEELLSVASHLQWCASLLSAAGCLTSVNHVAVLEHAASILRSLRHSDGSLTRFHGGGNPQAGELDRVLAETRPTTPAASGLAMGFARMSAGRTSVIMDTAPPQTGWQSGHAHASTLAFEMVTGKMQLVVNQGPAVKFGPDAHRRARATASHSTVEIDGSSSSRLNAPVFQVANREEIFVVCPDDVRIEQLPGDDGFTMIVSHNGYAALFGLTHMRRLDLQPDGRKLWAEDTLWARPGEDRRVFESAVGGTGRDSLPFAARFHLHPDTEVSEGPNARRFKLTLHNGETWMFRFDGAARLELEPSEYFDELSGRIRQSRQIVLRSQFVQGSAQLRWEFELSQRGR